LIYFKKVIICFIRHFHSYRKHWLCVFCWYSR